MHASCYASLCLLVVARCSQSCLCLAHAGWRCITGFIVQGLVVPCASRGWLYWWPRNRYHKVRGSTTPRVFALVCISPPPLGGNLRPSQNTTCMRRMVLIPFVSCSVLLAVAEVVWFIDCVFHVVRCLVPISRLWSRIRNI